MSSETIRATTSQVRDLFNILKKDSKTGEWKGKAEAARKTGFSRPTIDKIIQRYPQGIGASEKPKKTLPKYYDDFAKTPCAEAVTNYAGFYAIDPDDPQKKRVFTKHGKTTYATLREAFKIIGKDPLDFTVKDFLVFFGEKDRLPHEDFIDPQTGAIEFGKAVHIRFAMARSNDPDIRALISAKDTRFWTKGIKREPSHKHMYLEPAQVIKLAQYLKRPDTLMLLYMGVLLGGRFSAFARLKNENVHREAGYIDLYESKIKKTVEKDFFEPEMGFVFQYISDFQRHGKLFERNLDFYNAEFQSVQEAALPEIQWSLSTHKILKHTAVTLMSLHGVSGDSISEYIGTDAATINKFYRGGGRVKIRAEIGGVQIKGLKTWREFVNEITPHFKARYEAIKGNFSAVDGIKAK